MLVHDGTAGFEIVTVAEMPVAGAVVTISNFGNTNAAYTKVAVMSLWASTFHRMLQACWPSNKQTARIAVGSNEVTC
jgi:hypothetical protein